ncbi:MULTISPECIES: AraC family transcriptional regulator [unclassified Treponema]|uniref:helix-turn-helix domain-containing protein n=1 Tax=unclassified Treponema TaxID=2638727 RepID=UPI0020A5B636|nr:MULTISPECIES: AraC family transcriptional regulator [unclassified Treponema]UTC68323.1 helix-turn-helix transcriptional regulator [Treponema sp. OMZ 789]UTC71044.1 helix-turn-helix transcriptional regulator [Treponema sp. OMZ 790]UTC73785.1 helix-turn-helix transcriptional regulator [Treponema sp. OMZ 791]
MRTLEDYWKDFEDFGFVKHLKDGRIDYILGKTKGSGGFSVLGDTGTAMAVISDCTLYQPFIIKEYIDEWIIEAGQYYTGAASYYQQQDDSTEFEYGLNAYVNYDYFYGYKRIEPNVRLVNIGFAFRKTFFSSLPITLEDDFFERAASVLNPEPIVIPKITAICDSLKECTLEGAALKLYIQGKCLEVFSLLYDYVYKAQPKTNVHLSQKDKAVLKNVKTFIEEHFADHFTIAELTKKFSINQQKLVTGFKDCFNTTINEYTQKVRMARALELLYNDELSIVEIAQAVGYYGDGYFQKAFKETYGISPARMRKDL